MSYVTQIVANKMFKTCLTQKSLRILVSHTILLLIGILSAIILMNIWIIRQDQAKF